MQHTLVSPLDQQSITYLKLRFAKVYPESFKKVQFICARLCVLCPALAYAPSLQLHITRLCTANRVIRGVHF